MPFNREIVARAAETRAIIEAQRDVDPAELITTFEASQITDLDRFQQLQTAAGHPEVAISDEFCKQNPRTFNILTANTTTYEDELEDALLEDNVISALMKKRQADPNNSAIGAAIRTRRSVIVYMLVTLMNTPDTTMTVGNTDLSEAS